MSKAPDGLEPPPPGGPDELKPIDQAMLLAIGRHKDSSTPLSMEQERLVDDWIAERLSPDDAHRAVQLTKRNGFAAERVLERRLLAAADTGGDIPAALSARVLAAGNKATARPAKAEPRTSWFRLPSFSGLQWSAAGAAFAALVAVAVVSFQNLQERSRSEQRVQFAMVTIDDRGALSPNRMRSLGNQPTASTENLFRDIDIPGDLMRRAVVNSSGADRTAIASELMSYLPLPANPATRRVQILIDSTLTERLFGEWRTRAVLPLRVYDLDDARTAAIRSAIRTQAADGAMILLTVRP